MAITTVTHRAPAPARLTPTESRAFDLLAAQSQAPTFDLSALLASARSFPAPRSTGQSVTSGTWGREELYGVDQHSGRALVVGHHVERGAGVGIRPGLTCTLHLGPGLAALAVADLLRVEGAAARAEDAMRSVVGMMVPAVPFGPVPADSEPLWAPSRVPSRVITDWSAKSRRRMLRGFAAVDWTTLHRPGHVLGMVTLTYPGNWLQCAPTGRVAKRHLRAFRQAFYRATGQRLDGAWKMEFQGRGAPHFHLFVPVPPSVDGEPFEAWLSRTWARIVARSMPERIRRLHVASGNYSRHLLAGTGVDFSKVGRMSDPKRLAVYFYKHGTKAADGKEYQHVVPREWLVDRHGEVNPEAGPGRFWGFWGMPTVDVVVELDAEDFVVARRIMRKVAAARARKVAYSRARHVLPAHVAMHPSRVRKMIGTKPPRSRAFSGGRMQGGFVIVHDGDAFARQLSRALNLARL